MASRVKLKSFQKKTGLKVTGHYDPATRQEIRRARSGKPSQTPKAKVARRKARDNDPNQILAPLTPKTLKAEVQSGVNQRYGTSERSLTDEIRVAGVQPSRIDQAYDQYVKALEASSARSVAAYDQVAQGVQGQIASDTAGSGSEQAQQAQLSRRALLQSGATAAGRDRASAVQYGGESLSAGHLGRVRAQEGQRNVSANLAVKLRELEQEKGDYANTLTRDARTAERNNQLQLQTLGLNTTKASNDAAAKKATAAATRDAKRQALALQKAGLDERKQHDRAGESVAQQNADTAAARAQAAQDKKDAKKGKGKGPTHAAKVTAANRLATARSLLGGATGSRTLLFDFLVQKKGIPADLAKAAVELKFDGGVNTALKDQLYRRYRIKLPHVTHAGRNATRAGNAGAGVAAALPTIKFPGVK